MHANDGRRAFLHVARCEIAGERRGGGEEPEGEDGEDERENAGLHRYKCSWEWGWRAAGSEKSATALRDLLYLEWDRMPRIGMQSC